MYQNSFACLIFTPRSIIDTVPRFKLYSSIKYECEGYSVEINRNKFHCVKILFYWFNQ